MVQRRLNGLIFTLLIWPYYWTRIRVWWPLRKKTENRVDDMNRLIAARPENAQFYVWRAWAIADVGEPLDVGFADCEKALQLKPALDKSAEFHLARSQLHLANRDLDNALADADLAIKADRTSRTAYFLRAIVRTEKRDFPLAVADYREGLKYDFGMNRTQYAEVYIAIAENYLRMREYQKALDEFEKAANYSPNHMEITQGRIFAYILLEDIDAINAQIALIPRHDTENQALAINARGHVYLAKGLTSRAMEDFEEALRLFPNHWELLLNRGMGHLHLKNQKAAMRDMEQAIALCPNNAHIYNTFGFTALVGGEIETAQDAITRAIELRPTFESAYDSRGHLHLLTGAYTSALQDFEAAMKGYPQESTRISAMAGQAVAHYALNDADSIDTAVAQWRALCERYDDRDLLVYLRERMVWPSRSLELAEQLNALTFPSSSPSP